ncbi:MAG TPA: glycosyltransferase [Actinophytocola sp.]|jgi:glycosyltransferase involved in cell wall biosynthesis|uniref:glycosyltransferase family 2 protein n=1 Tax=Actinophytocola sp. TaxID=1872138 RepID=UPI002E05D256|nr:glycosyltransferase [Actinophytocola sp.]
MISLDVLIPYHGDANYLVRAVESVRTLIDTDWMLTIVEDNYPDGLQVQRRIEDLGDERIRYLRNKRQLGTAGNHSRCAQLAEREQFVVMGSDDVLLPCYGQTLANLLSQYPSAAMVQPGIQVIDESGQPYRSLGDHVKDVMRPRGDVIELRGEAAAASLLRGNWLYTPAIAYRRDHVVDLPMRPGNDAVHDLALVVDILLAGGSLVVSRQVAFLYRRHRNSHSSMQARTGQRFRQERSYFVGIEAELRMRDWQTAARAARRRLLSRCNALTQLPGALLSGERRVAGELLSHVLRR